METRVNRFIDGDVEGLLSDFVALEKKRTAFVDATKGSDEENALRRFAAAHTDAGAGDMRTAMRKLQQNDGVVANTHEALRCLAPLHPAEGALDATQAAALRAAAAASPGLELTAGAVEWALRRSRSRAAPGPSGWNFKHWKDIALEDHDVLDGLTKFLNASMMKGCLPEPLQMMWGACNTIALAKAAKSGYRPVSMGDVLRRVAGKAGMHTLLERVKGLNKHFEPLQWAINSKEGTENIVKPLRALVNKHPDYVLYGIDARNAFNTMKRSAFIDQLLAGPFKALVPYVAQFYSVEGDLLIRGKGGLSILKSRSGQQQGDTVGSLLFALGLHPILQDINNDFLHLGVTIRAYCDDVFLHGPPIPVAAAYEVLKSRMAAINLSVAFKNDGSKTRAWSPAWEGPNGAAALAAAAVPKDIFRCSGGMKVLGAYIGTDAFVSSSVLACVADESDAGISGAYNCVAEYSKCTLYGVETTALSLLRMCVATKFDFLKRTTPHGLLTAADVVHTRLLMSTLSTITEIDDESELKALWKRICLPIKMKGMGFRCGAAAAAAAYIASEYACAPAVSAALNAQANKVAFDNWEAECAEPSSSTATPPAPPVPLPFTVPASVAESIAEARKLLPDAANAFLDETPIDPPKDAPSLSNLQRRLTRFVEVAAFDRLKGAARGERDAAHFNSNDGTWLFTTPLAHLRLSGAHLRARLRRYLNLTIPVCAGITLGSGKNAVAADLQGDFALSVFNGGKAWNNLHNAIRDTIATFGRQAGLDVDVEPVRLLRGKDGKVTKSRPADIRIRGAHGWRAAGNREMWIDVTTISAVCAKHRAKCAEAAGGGSAVAAASKNGKYVANMKASGNYGYFLPLAFESEGYMPNAVSQLLGPWSKLWAEKGGYSPEDAGCRKRIWLNELAHIHARYVAQAILDNSKWAREGCIAGKSAEGRAPLLSANDAALPLGFGY